MRYEIDFVVNRGPKQMYIQSAYSIPTAEKREQETFSLRHTGDSFRKVVITNDPFQTRTYDDNGIAYIGLMIGILYTVVFVLAWIIDCANRKSA